MIRVAPIALAIVVVSSSAFAEKPDAPSRIFFEQEVGLLVPGATSIDGQKKPNEGGEFYFGFKTGYSHTLGDPRYGLVLLNRFASGDTNWSRQRGESRLRIDLALGPELRLPQRDKRPWVGWHFNLPVGVTLLHAKPGPGRAVSEDYGAGHGFNFGLNGAISVAGQHHGGSIGGGYLLHMTWIDHTAWLTSDPSTKKRERVKMLDHVLMFTIAYAYWL